MRKQGPHICVGTIRIEMGWHHFWRGSHIFKGANLPNSEIIGLQKLAKWWPSAETRFSKVSLSFSLHRGNYYHCILFSFQGSLKVKSHGMSLNIWLFLELKQSQETKNSPSLAFSTNWSFAFTDLFIHSLKHFQTVNDRKYVFDFRLKPNIWP